MNRLLISTLVLLCLSTGAYADDDSDSLFYVEAGIGHVSVNYNSLSEDAVNQGVIDGVGTSESLLGGFVINPNFALELGYHDYGSPAGIVQNGVDVSSTCPGDFSCPHITGITAEAVGRYEIMPDLTVEVLGGVLAWHAGAPAGIFIGKTTGTSLAYGLRLRKDLHDAMEGWSADVTYEHSAFSTDEVRLGLRYNF